MPKKEPLITRDDYFEILDRAHMMEKFFNEALVKHPLLKKEKSLRNAVTQISTLLGDLTQEAGTRLWDIDDGGMPV